MRYQLTDDAKTEDTINNWKFKTDFWVLYQKDGNKERPELPDPDSKYLDMQLYLKSNNLPEDSTESSIVKKTDTDGDVYIEEEGKAYDMNDDFGWEAVGEKIRIDIR